ncbi:NAD(P)H-binding protein [Kribbella solani]|uniref:NAD(P)H-binding protein n=1 Tax=Kribbella solani TaxID=236067 RepID=UPI0029B092B1|nr:NAD(P)H-binding protein [Kribbella solani]MDX3006572.1 NAD(P)H-binding protein [Kribbella solani]
MTVLVTGATGNAGGAVVRALAAAGVPGKALVRGKAELLAGIEPVYGDLGRPDTFVEALDGISAIFLLSGYERVEELLANAVKAGVERVVLLSSSSVDSEQTSNAIAQYHLAAENAVDASGLDWTFLRPNSFMSNTLRWLDQLRLGNVVRVQFPDIPVATIHPDDVADVALHAMTGNGHSRTVYRLTGPVALKPSEQVEILGQALGRPLRAHELSRAESHEQLFASMPAPYAEAIERFFGDGIIDETAVNDTVETITGHPARTLQDWTRTNTNLFS